MTLKEIISQVDWNEVAIAIVSERPYQRPVLEGFRKVFESLMTMGICDAWTTGCGGERYPRSISERMTLGSRNVS